MQAFGFISEQLHNACIYCSEFVQEDECHIDDMSDQLCCASCLWSSDRSANWWGQDTDIECGEEEDSFDFHWGSVDDDLIEEVPWHIQVSLMKKNHKMVPSTSTSSVGGKT